MTAYSVVHEAADHAYSTCADFWVWAGSVAVCKLHVQLLRSERRRKNVKYSGF